MPEKICPAKGLLLLPGAGRDTRITNADGDSRVNEYAHAAPGVEGSDAAGFVIFYDDILFKGAGMLAVRILRAPRIAARPGVQ